MTTITILPEEKNFRAVAGEKESIGRTAGEALDALTAQLDEEETGTLVIVQNRRSDKFFNASQQKRLTSLMEKRKTDTLSAAEETELENLIETELNGARQRAEELLHELKP
ncbi:MAG TPA: hypothetical protein VK400_12620 [Pyrinomonadaceae bacterium]|nr:hypothetical protein [Pyrinomonadaceae bacterium]